MLLYIAFAGITALTISLWLVDRNPDTNPVADLGFFALGAVIIAVGFAVQLRRVCSMVLNAHLDNVAIRNVRS